LRTTFSVAASGEVLIMTVEEIEQACDIGRTLDFSKHELEGPELSLKKVFHPFGFPVEVRSNSDEVLTLLEQIWGKFEKQHDTEPVRCDVYVVEDGTSECPPAPMYQMMYPLMIHIADGRNYSLIDMERRTTQISISRAALQYPLYLKYFLLGNAMCCIVTSYVTPIHAGCVALDNHGVLLCGDSGAGKSSLSFACARNGWTYISDDSTYLLNDEVNRIVTGDCHQVRLRPSAATLFPEVKGLEITPRAAGKPSIEMPTAGLPSVVCAKSAQVDFVVFLNRHSGASPSLVPYRKDVARYFMRQVLYGSAESLAVQYQAIERLLTVEVFELRYTDLDWAVDRLQKLVRKGT
jgi:hypothetical protein